MALASSMRWRFWTKAAERVKIDALVLVVVVIIVGGGGGSDGGSQRGPRRCIFCRVCYCCPAIPSHLMAALAFTSTTAPETAARAPLLSPLMEVALQRQGGWCCDEKLTTCFR